MHKKHITEKRLTLHTAVGEVPGTISGSARIFMFALLFCYCCVFIFFKQTLFIWDLAIPLQCLFILKAVYSYL